MDNAQKAIMIGVGLFITIIIIAAVMLITGLGQDLITNSTTQVSNISTSLQKQLTDTYDDSIVTGAQVISAIKRYCTDEAMILVVNNSGTVTEYGKIKGDSYTAYPTGASGIDDRTGYTINSTASNTATGVGKLSDSTSDTYVPNTAKYEAVLIKFEGTDTVAGIYFTRK